MELTPVDCIACLVAAPRVFAWGWRDEDGVVHYAKWARRGYVFMLCDFVDDRSPGPAKKLNLHELIAVAEDV